MYNTAKKEVPSAEIETSKKMVGIVDLQAPKAKRKKVKQSLTPQEAIAKLRARSAEQAEAQRAPTFDEMVAERKQRNEEAYCEKLQAEGKPIYTLDDVAAIGYEPDPSWTQKDLQVRMVVGPVFLPLRQLEAKADEYHNTFVVPGRKALLELMSEAYRVYLIAVLPERSKVVFERIRGRVEERLKRKLAADVSNASLFIRCVFKEFDDRKVHLYSRALEFAHSSNVSADDFKKWVTDMGGWEKVRAEAAKAFNGSPDAVAARTRRENEQKEAEELVDRWKKLRGVIDTLQLSGDLPKRMGRHPKRFLLEVTWLPDFHESVGVYAGNCEVIDIMPMCDAVTKALQDTRVAEVKLSGDELRRQVEALEERAQGALDEQTKARLAKAAELRAKVLARNEANVAATQAAQAAKADLKTFA